MHPKSASTIFKLGTTQFVDFWDWRAMRATCRDCRNSLEFRSRLLDGPSKGFASFFEWDCDQLREFFFVSHSARTKIAQLLPYAEEAMALLAPRDAEDRGQLLEDILQGRNIVGAVPSHPDQLSSGHLKAKRAYWYNGEWVTGRELSQILEDEDIPDNGDAPDNEDIPDNENAPDNEDVPGNGNAFGSEDIPDNGESREATSDATGNIDNELAAKIAEAPYSWKTIAQYPEHLVELLATVERAGTFEELQGSGELRITRDDYFSRSFRERGCRNRPSCVHVLGEELQVSRIPRISRKRNVANSRGKWSRLLYCLVDSYASPSGFASSAKFLLDKRFVSLLSREFPAVALKLLGYSCIGGEWCRLSSRSLKELNNHALAAAVAKGRHDRALVMKRLSFDCVLSPQMLRNKVSMHHYRSVDVCDDMRELVKLVLFDSKRMLLNRQPRESRLRSHTDSESDFEGSLSDDDGNLSSDEDSDGRTQEAFAVGVDRSRRCTGSICDGYRNCEATTYLKVLSLRDTWRRTDEPTNNISGATKSQKRNWRRDALGFINRVCAEGPAEFLGDAEFKTVVLTPLLRLMDCWRDLAVRFVQVYFPYLHPYITELPTQIEMTVHAPATEQDGGNDLCIKRRMQPTTIEELDDFFEDLEDSDGKIDRTKVKFYVQASGRAACRVLAWKVIEERTQQKHERKLEALEAFRVKLDAAAQGVGGEEAQKFLEDEFTKLRTHWMDWPRTRSFPCPSQERNLEQQLTDEIKMHREIASDCEDDARLYSMLLHMLASISFESIEGKAVRTVDGSSSSPFTRRMRAPSISGQETMQRQSALESFDRFRRLICDHGFHLVPAVRQLGERFDESHIRDDVLSFRNQLDRGEVQVVDSDSEDYMLRDW